jgi:hypothetical protein
VGQRRWKAEREEDWEGDRKTLGESIEALLKELEGRRGEGAEEGEGEGCRTSIGEPIMLLDSSTVDIHMSWARAQFL